MSTDTKTVSGCYQLIEKEYKWRIIELSNYKSSLLSERNEKAIKSKVRAGVTLLYAHWEGFIKQIASYYYEYVSYQSLKLEELNDTFISIVLRNELKTIQNSNKIKDHTKAIQLIFDGKNKVAYFSSNPPIKTGNLKYEVFEDICQLLGVGIEEFELRYRRRFTRSVQLTIDEDLVKRRNLVAHGEYLPVSLEDFKELYDVVVNGFLFTFKELVMDSIYKKKFRRQTI